MIHKTIETLAEWYLDPAVEEVAINRPGEIWLRARKPAPGEPVWTAHEDSRLTHEYLMKVCHFLANYRDVPFDEDKLPLLYTTAPGGHRFTAAVGPMVVWDREARDGVAIAIRQWQPDDAITLDDYRRRPEQAERERALRHASGPISEQEALDIIKSGGSAMIVGQTSSGKTKFLNILLNTVLDRSLRVITLEDTAELTIPHPNRVPLVLSRTEQVGDLDYPTLVNFIVRMTPDAVLLGEISTLNAGVALELMGTGHRNFMFTIHGESAIGGLRAFIQRLTHVREGLDPRSALAILAGGLDVVIHLDRSGNVRFHDEIVRAKDLAESVFDKISK